jgi:Flp pilus assembly protein TadB
MNPPRVEQHRRSAHRGGLRMNLERVLVLVVLVILIVWLVRTLL